MKFHIPILLLCLALCSCEKSITISLPEVPKKLVVNSVVFQGEYFHANLSRSLSNAESGKGIDASVSGAQVVLFRDGQPVDTLSDQGYGLYISDIEATAGHQYRLIAKHPAYEMLEAETSAPEPVSISDWSVSRRVRSNPNSGDQDLLQLSFNDPAPMGDHYLMQIIRGFDFQGGNTDFYSWDYCLQLTDPSFESPYSAEFPGEEVCFPSRSLFLKDDLFNGKKKELSLYVPSSLLEPNIYWPSPDSVFSVLRLFHVTPDFYQFVKSYRASRNASDNPFAEPFNVITSVKGGYGIFTVLSEEWIEVK